MPPDELDGPAVYHLLAPARPQSVELAHEIIGQLWTHEPPPTMTDRIRFETAVIEILANIIEHAALLESPHLSLRQFDLTVSLDAERIEALFGDEGKPAQIDLEGVSMPSEAAESGRGLALALASVDEMSYERVGPVNHWRLVCHRQH